MWINVSLFPEIYDLQYFHAFKMNQQVLKHKIDNIKRMSAHPLMPLYLTGSQDGSVQMWEWGHQQAVCTPRPPGTFAKGWIFALFITAYY